MYGPAATAVEAAEPRRTRGAALRGDSVVASPPTVASPKRGSNKRTAAALSDRASDGAPADAPKVAPAEVRLDGLHTDVAF